MLAKWLQFMLLTSVLQKFEALIDTKPLKATKEQQQCRVQFFFLHLKKSRSAIICPGQ